jgi:hypothetical protein
VPGCSVGGGPGVGGDVEPATRASARLESPDLFLRPILRVCLPHPVSFTRRVWQFYSVVEGPFGWSSAGCHLAAPVVLKWDTTIRASVSKPHQCAWSRSDASTAGSSVGSRERIHRYDREGPATIAHR